MQPKALKGTKEARHQVILDVLPHVLPTNAVELAIIGNCWFEFKLDGNKYMGRATVLGNAIKINLVTLVK